VHERRPEPPMMPLMNSTDYFLEQQTLVMDIVRSVQFDQVVKLM
jgi:hypothetical protein